MYPSTGTKCPLKGLLPTPFLALSCPFPSRLLPPSFPFSSTPFLPPSTRPSLPSPLPLSPPPSPPPALFPSSTGPNIRNSAGSTALAVCVEEEECAARGITRQNRLAVIEALLAAGIMLMEEEGESFNQKSEEVHYSYLHDNALDLFEATFRHTWSYHRP